MHDKPIDPKGLIDPGEIIDFDLLPFSPLESNAIKEQLQLLAKGVHHEDPEVILGACWTEIREAALLAKTLMELGKEYKQPLLAKTLMELEREDEPRRSRVGGKLRRIANARKPRLPSQGDWEALYALMFGAARLGLIPNPPDEAMFRQAIGELTHDQLRQCAERALTEPMLPAVGDSKPMLVGDTGGRPNATIIDYYVRTICGTYSKISGRRIAFSRNGMEDGEPTGPLLRFLRTCLVPSIGPQLSDEAIVSAVRRARALATRTSER